MRNGVFEIRVVTPWPVVEFEFDGVRVSSESANPNPDALLCFWRPAVEMLEFAGPRCLYNCEPTTTAGMGARAVPEWREILDQLADDEWLWHAHPDANFRVPHVTHRREFAALPSVGRLAQVIAVVSNSGPSVKDRSKAVEERNVFASSKSVDLFGSIERRWRRPILT